MGTTRSRSGGSQQREPHHSQPGGEPKTGFVLPREGRCRVRKSTTTTKEHHQRDNVVVADRGGRMTDESQTPLDYESDTARLWRNKAPLRQQATEDGEDARGCEPPAASGTIGGRRHSTRGNKLTRVDTRP